MLISDVLFFNCIAAAKTTISDRKKHIFEYSQFNIRNTKSLYMVNIHLCRYQLLRDQLMI